MNKFTLFTILFSLSLMVIMADLVIRDYVADKDAQTSVLTAENPLAEADIPVPQEASAETSKKEVVVEEPDPIEDATTGFEDPLLKEAAQDFASQAAAGGMPVLNEKLLGNSGFTNVSAVLFDNKVFQLFDISGVERSGISYFQATDLGGSPVGVFLEVELSDEISAQQFYDFIENKSRVYLDLSVNESNTFGDRSLYINHVKKSAEAFLVVKQGKYVYALAYAKGVHNQVKTLISLLTPAILDRQFTE